MSRERRSFKVEVWMTLDVDTEDCEGAERPDLAESVSAAVTDALVYDMPYEQPEEGDLVQNVVEVRVSAESVEALPDETYVPA